MTAVSSTETVSAPAPRQPADWPLVAMREAPRIVCPDWCNLSEAQHAERLRDNDGVVFHESDYVDGWSRTVTTFVDGTPVPGEPVRLYVEEPRDVRLEGITVADAETFARSILAAVEEARA